KTSQMCAERLDLPDAALDPLGIELDRQLRAVPQPRDDLLLVVDLEEAAPQVARARCEIRRIGSVARPGRPVAMRALVEIEVATARLRARFRRRVGGGAEQDGETGDERRGREPSQARPIGSAALAGTPRGGHELRRGAPSRSSAHTASARPPPVPSPPRPKPAAASGARSGRAAARPRLDEQDRTRAEQRDLVARRAPTDAGLAFRLDRVRADDDQPDAM